MKKLISVLLIITGITLILLPFITDEVIKLYSKKISVEDISPETLKVNNEAKGDFDFSAIKDVDISSVLKGAMNYDTDLVIGSLVIPDLNAELPIFKGITDANLLVGVGTMREDQIMGKGNYTLSGHHMKDKDLLFGALMDIEIGTKVFMSNGETIYEYKIYDTVVVPDTSTGMLLDKKSTERGKPIISLMTCFHTSKTGKRFFALGELVDEYPID